MPSEWEGFGLAAVEGLAFGKPVVAAPVGGLKMIIDNQCGRLCETKEEFVSEIERLLLDESYYNAKYENAKMKAGEYDNIKSYAQQIYKVYHCVTKHYLSE